MTYSIRMSSKPYEYRNGMYCDILDGHLQLDEYLWTNQLREVKEACNCLAYVHALMTDPVCSRWDFMEGMEGRYWDVEQFVPAVFVPYVWTCFKAFIRFESDMYEIGKVKHP